MTDKLKMPVTKIYDSFCILRISHRSELSTILVFSIESEDHLMGMIFEDVIDDQKESLNLKYPMPSSSTVDVHSSASSALASKFPSGLKSPSGIIFIVYFSSLHLLKISKPFPHAVVLPHGCYTECYIM